MLYTIDADRAFYRVGRRRYFSVLSPNDAIRNLGPSVILYLWVVGYGVYLLAAAVGLLPFPREGMGAAVVMTLMFPWVCTLIRMISARTFRGHIDVLVSASGLQIHAGKLTGPVAWDEIVRGVRLHDGILLLQKGCLYRWLPDSALRNADPLDVVQLLKSHVALDVRA